MKTTDLFHCDEMVGSGCSYNAQRDDHEIKLIFISIQCISRIEEDEENLKIKKYWTNLVHIFEFKSNNTASLECTFVRHHPSYQ